ncbi:MAG: BrnA antitoxin family protein [Betaproteobacteria bacterium]|nr:BrnA antitoxin family protein [Betaproteobacteria bacterium]
MARARPAAEVLPQIFGAEIAQKILRPRGRPRAAQPKELINIRLSHEVIEHFKSSGQGWQTRIDSALRQFIAEHPIGR